MTKTALLFPGQGSQSMGMLAALASVYPQVQSTFVQGGEALGMDLWALVNEGPAEELNRTEITQPVMLVADIAVYRVWQARGGPEPEALAGHSLGEYAALVAAGAIGFADAVRVVAQRGRLMQEAVPEGHGAMAAILGLDDDVVAAICREAAEGDVVAPANFNSPGQLVIAGDIAAVERAMHRCRDAGAKRAMILPVSVPSHSPLMQGAATVLGEALATIDIQSPATPVIHNADVSSHKDPDAIRQALVKQLHQPVRWTETIRALSQSGIQAMAECGPGRVLCGLGRRIDRTVNWLPLEQPELLDAALEALTPGERS
ncbi:MAG: [acyl-carrier-protein] S-malonyltransferase [Wenzhouxiangellaceae bacterium]|nr:MAG: [acyl-carrier-protein] S-malonyltransferase [Wenzhouxiangellaceae bacterium]